MAKPEKKREARQYRKQGKSMNWIADKIGVSRSSVSLWTRDIQLTPEQEEALSNSNERREAQQKGARANVIKHRNLRKGYQKEGRIKARQGDALHLADYMLYWAEGSKNRNNVELVNSDVDMLVYFVRFLRESLNVRREDIRFRINAYLGNGLSEEEIIDFWLKTLNLDIHNMNKCSFNKQPSSSKQRGRKLPYGVCEVSVTSTQLCQHIYGAIQDYANIDKPEWLD